MTSVFPRLFPTSLAVLLALAVPGGALAQGDEREGDEVPSIGERTADLESQDGFIPIHYERSTGKLFLEVRPDGEELLYLNTLATGLGSMRALLDRGQVGTEALVRFERHGGRVLLVRLNTRYRAETDEPALRRSVEESFPPSVLTALPIEAEEGDRLLVDATELALSDAFDVIGELRDAGIAGNGGAAVRLDRDRSHVRMARTKAFPRNTEIRAALTFTSEDPDGELRRMAPDGRSFALEQHHSFVRLPEPGYRPREFDPRGGIFAVAFYDYARGFDEGYRRGHLVRWRLEPKDRAAYERGELVEPVRPIVYYLDPAIPEPYRSAFREGGMWWNGVFEAAGFRNAFRIEDLPADVDPMDARYSVIQWVHRLEPGPSVGPSYHDPRTGEIIKTNIRMDSHRSLVDHNIYMGLVPAGGRDGLGVDAEAFAMARRRQHSAHEIGHTLGLAHNFIAATQGRASVMDYPAPLVRLDDRGRLDLSEAYRPSAGAHDSLAIRFAYTWFPTREAEAAGLERILRDGLAEGLRFITGGHAALSGSVPGATQWVEGSDMLEALDRTTAVRRVLIERFDERAVAEAEPLSVLNQRFAHVYLHHRYALQGAIKHIGGMELTYALRADGQVPTRIVPADAQRRALRGVLAALQPAELAIPERVSALMAPPPFGSDGSERWIESPGGPAFDPVTTAHSLAQEIADGLLHPERAARVASFHARDGSLPSLDDVIGALLDATWGQEVDAGMEGALRRAAQRAALDALLDLAGDERATPEVRAAAESRLSRLRDRIAESPSAAPATAAHRAMARRDIDRYFAGEDDPEKRPRPAPIPLPWP